MKQIQTAKTKKEWVKIMANCKQCGTDLNGARFCPNCGASATGDLVQHGYAGVPMGADTRQRSLADMEHMLNYFGANKQMYDDFEAVSKEVEDRSTRGYGGWIGTAIMSVLIGVFAEAAFFYVAAVAFVAMFVMLKKKNKGKLAIAVAKQNDLKNQLEEYYNAYGYCSVGLEYTKPSTLQALYELVRKGRASTPGDAINIYLADQEQAEMRRLQEEATKAAKETAKNTKKAAKNAKKAAGYASASFWFK